MNDRSVIDAFVAHLREEGYPDLRVERRPDDENRESSDIDAITGPFAIEHTSIDTLPNPYRRQLTGPLQRGQTQTIAPGRRGIKDGATTAQSCPSPVRVR